MLESDSRARVLVVDDDPMSLMLLGRILKDAGCNVETASSGEDAIAFSESPDLVILDISLPGIDGYEVARRLKSTDSGESLPIIFISSHSKPVDKARAFESGATDYITKPFDFEEVRLRVENQLRLAELQHKVKAQNRVLQEKNRELERFVAAIQEREEDEPSEPATGSDSGRLLSGSKPGLDRVFTALSEVLPGTVLDKRYRLETLIGSGGFGAVYKARHLVLERPIAVKVLQPPRGENAERQLDRFRAEAISAYRFNHPNAVSVLDASVSTSGLPYIVMELLEGWSLREEIQNSGGLSLKRCAEIMVPVCDVISRAHKAGMTHRDLKPDNIFIDQPGATESVKVLDFGLARLQGEIDSAETNDKGEVTIIGTPAYMAPESFGGKETDAEKLDMYAIAAVTFEILTGRPPFVPDAGGLASLITQHLTAPPPRLRELVPDAPSLVENLLLAGLEKKPESRPDVRAFAEQLIIATISDGEALSEEGEQTLRLKPLDDD